MSTTAEIVGVVDTVKSVVDGGDEEHSVKSEGSGAGARATTFEKSGAGASTHHSNGASMTTFLGDQYQHWRRDSLSTHTHTHTHTL